MAKFKQSKRYKQPSYLRKKRATPHRILFAILTITAFVGMLYGYSFLLEQRNYTASNAIVTNPVLLTENLPFDIAYGDINAPVTIVEYASLTCWHCKSFYEDVFTLLKNNYIDSGKVRFVYRHYPLNKPALDAALLLSCLPPDTEQSSLLGALFATQEEWGHTYSRQNQEGALRRLFSSLSNEKYANCLMNNVTEEALLAEQLRAKQELGINSTPTFFINGELYSGRRTYDSIVSVIDNIIKMR